MSDFIVIGMTGPTGSGKSTVSELLRERGFKIVDADKVARRVTEKGSPTLGALCDAFGDDILYPCGELDRAALAKKAFADSESVGRLNAITHPAIIELIKAEIDALRASGESRVVLDAPQLFEAGADKLCDMIFSVLSDKETRLARIMSRDSITEEQALSRINAQKSDEFFVENSDFVIYNNSDVMALVPQVDLLVGKTMGERAQKPEKPIAPQPRKGGRRTLVGAVAILLGLIAVAIVLLTGKGYTKAIEKSLELYKNPCRSTIEQIYPDQMWDVLIRDRYSVIDPEISSVDEVVDKYILPEMQKVSAQKNADYGDDWELDYDVISEQRLEKSVLDEISADLSATTGRDMKVKKAYSINLSYSISGSKKTTGNYVSFTVVKIGSDWYVADSFSDIGWRLIVLEL